MLGFMQKTLWPFPVSGQPSALLLVLAGFGHQLLIHFLDRVSSGDAALRLDSRFLLLQRTINSPKTCLLSFKSFPVTHQDVVSFFHEELPPPPPTGLRPAGVNQAQRDRALQSLKSGQAHAWASMRAERRRKRAGGAGGRGFLDRWLLQARKWNLRLLPFPGTRHQSLRKWGYRQFSDSEGEFQVRKWES